MQLLEDQAAIADTPSQMSPNPISAIWRQLSHCLQSTRLTWFSHARGVTFSFVNGSL